MVKNHFGRNGKRESDHAKNDKKNGRFLWGMQVARR